MMSSRGEVKSFHGFEEGVIGQGSGQVIDQIHGGGKEGFDALQTGLITQGQSDMGFPGSRRSHEDDILFLLDEAEIKEVEDLRFIDRFGEGEVEGVDGFDGGEVGLEDAGFDASLLSGGDFLRGQDEQEIGGGEIFLCRPS